MKITESVLNNLKRWAEGKKKTEGLHGDYWTGYVKAIDDILLLLVK